jgi:hypothetical protein
MYIMIFILKGPKVTYIPPPPPEDEDSIFAHYQTGINFDKYDTILVEVSGHDAPPAILVSICFALILSGILWLEISGTFKLASAQNSLSI